MGIDDSAIRLLEVANEELKHPDLHYEPLLSVVLLHHLVEGRSNFVDLALPRKMQRRRMFARL